MCNDFSAAGIPESLAWGNVVFMTKLQALSHIWNNALSIHLATGFYHVGWQNPLANNSWSGLKQHCLPCVKALDSFPQFVTRNTLLLRKCDLGFFFSSFSASSANAAWAVVVCHRHPLEVGTLKVYKRELRVEWGKLFSLSHNTGATQFSWLVVQRWRTRGVLHHTAHPLFMGFAVTRWPRGLNSLWKALNEFMDERSLSGY